MVQSMVYRGELQKKLGGSVEVQGPEDPVPLSLGCTLTHRNGHEWTILVPWKGNFPLQTKGVVHGV